MICGVSGNAPTCGITVEKNLFTPRVGWAYRATESTVIRVGYSRNPENDTSGRNQMPPFQAFPATIILTETAPNTYSAVGSLSDGVTVVPQFDLTVGRVRPNAGLTTYRGKFVRGTITSWNASVQQLLPFGQSLTLGYVANRQRGITRNLNENYGQLGGGTASQPYRAITTAAINVQGPYGRVDYDSFQASVNKRFSSGLQYTVAYTFAKAIDWWAGTIPQPEYQYLNKGDQANSNPHLLNVSVIYQLPFGSGRRFLDNSGIASRIAGGWQINGFFTARSGTPFSVTASSASLNAGTGTTQMADQVKDDRRHLRVLAGRRVLRSHGLPAGHRCPVRKRRFQYAARTRGRQPGPQPVPHLRMEPEHEPAAAGRGPECDQYPAFRQSGVEHRQSATESRRHRPQSQRVRRDHVDEPPRPAVR